MIGLLGLIIYRVMLDVVYFNIISPVYAYAGFIDARDTRHLVVSWILFFVFYLFMRDIIFTEDDGIMHIVVMVLYCIVFVPFTSSVYMGFTTWVFVFWHSLYWIVFITVARCAFYMPKKRLPVLKVSQLWLDDRIVVAIGVAAFFVVFFISGRYAHFRLNFDLFSVYDLRLEARNFGMPTIMAYMFSWTKAINTIMLAYTLVRKRYELAAFFFAIQMLSFGIDGSKSTFFMPFLVIIAVVVYNIISSVALKLFVVYGLAGGSILALIEYLLLGSMNIATLFVRRLLFVPALLNEQYFDYFTKNQPDYFRGSFLRIIGAESPYASDGGIARMIGRVYYGSDVMNCNNGLFSDAFSNLGYIGVFVMPAIIVFFLYVFDRSTCGLDKRIVLASGLFVSLNIMSTSFTMVLLTHGFLVLILLTWMMNPENINEKKMENDYGIS